MEPAPDLIAFMERFNRGFLASDAKALTDVFSRQPTTLAIGTAEAEWWVGFDTIAALLKVQTQEFAELGGVRIDTEEVTAFKEGTVGWIAARSVVTVGSATKFSIRTTITLHEEGAYWRVVQYHMSTPVDNEETVGVPLTTAVDEILVLVQDDVPPNTAIANDGSVTIVFTDVEGSAALMESLGEASWLKLLGWHDAMVRQQTALFGGSVVKGQGDGYMLAFPAVGSAVSCAMAIQRSLGAGWSGVKVPVRIGMHVGNVQAEGGDFFGRTVVLAARVAGAAAGGEILVSQAVQEELLGAFPLGPVRALSLKGLAGDYTAFPLLWK